MRARWRRRHVDHRRARNRLPLRRRSGGDSGDDAIAKRHGCSNDRLALETLAHRAMRPHFTPATLASEKMRIDLRDRLGGQLPIGECAEQGGEPLVSFFALDVVGEQHIMSRVLRRTWIRHETPRSRARPGWGACLFFWASAFAHAVRLLATAPARSRRPREILLITVPIGAPTISAISAYLNPSMSCSSTTLAKSSGIDASAARSTSPSIRATTSANTKSP